MQSWNVGMDSDQTITVHATPETAVKMTNGSSLTSLTPSSVVCSSPLRRLCEGIIAVQGSLQNSPLLVAKCH